MLFTQFQSKSKSRFLIGNTVCSQSAMMKFRQPFAQSKTDASTFRYSRAFLYLIKAGENLLQFLRLNPFPTVPHFNYCFIDISVDMNRNGTGLRRIFKSIRK